MGWVADRPVPWRRLFKEWVIYAAVMAVVFALFFRSGGDLVPILAGLLVSLPLYLVLGYALAKFGYQRARLGERGTKRGSAASAAPTADGDPAPTERTRPAPTRRTSSGSNRPSKGKRR